jgi:YD repeat-containing protein
MLYFKGGREMNKLLILVTITICIFVTPFKVSAEITKHTCEIQREGNTPFPALTSTKTMDIRANSNVTVYMQNVSRHRGDKNGLVYIGKFQSREVNERIKFSVTMRNSPYYQTGNDQYNGRANYYVMKCGPIGFQVNDRDLDDVTGKEKWYFEIKDEWDPPLIQEADTAPEFLTDTTVLFVPNDQSKYTLSIGAKDDYEIEKMEVGGAITKTILPEPTTPQIVSACLEDIPLEGRLTRITLKVTDTSPTNPDLHQITELDISIVRLPPCGPKLTIGCQDEELLALYKEFIRIIKTGLNSLELTQTYSSDDTYNGPMGLGRTHCFNPQIMACTDGSDDYIYLRRPCSKRMEFKEEIDGTYTSTEPTNFIMEKTANGHALRLPDGSSYIFNETDNGFASYFIDNNNNTKNFSYDNEGKLIQMTDHQSNVFNIAYNSSNKIDTVSDQAGRQISMDYIAGLKGDVLLRAIDTGSGVYEFEYNDQDKLAAKQLAGGINRQVFVYDNFGKLRSTQTGAYSVSTDIDWDNNICTKTDSLGRKFIKRFNSDFQVTSTVDPIGGTTENSYNATSKKRIASRDAIGRLTSYAYDARGNPISTTLPDNTNTSASFDTINGKECIRETIASTGATTQYVYDAQGNKTTVVDALNNVTSISYTASGKVASVRDPLGNKTKIAYDGNDNPVQVEDAAGNVATTAYDTVGNVISQTGKRGNTTNYEFDGARQLTKIISPPNAQGQRASTIFTHNSAGQVTSKMLPSGATMSNSYDNYGRLVTSTDALGNSTSRTYDSAGRLKTVRDSKGGTITYNYDLLSRIVSTQDAAGNLNRLSFDTAGRRISTTDSEGNRTRIVYDNLRDWVNAIYHPDGSVTQFEHNIHGQQTAIIDAAGRRTEFEYDILGRQILRRRFLSGQPLVTRYEFDANGNQTKVIDESGRETVSIYNELNQLTATFLPSPDGVTPGPVTLREYDSEGNLTKLTKANGSEWKFFYDSLSRMVWEEDPLGNRKTYEHDINGNVTKKTDAKGQVTTYQYDLLSRLIRVDYADGEWSEMAYDSSGNRTNLTGSSGISISSTFDTLNRVKTIENSALKRKISYSYTSNSQRATMTVDNLINGEQNKTSYFWDSMGRVNQIVAPTNDLITYDYNLDGSRSTVSLPNNLTLNHTYDSLGRLTGMEYRNGNSQQIAFFNYTLDNADNRTTQTDVEGISQYEYDRLDRLVEANYPDGTWERFTMNVAGNRTRHEDNLGVTNYDYDIGDRLLSTSGASPSTYTWDLNGNMLEKETPDGLTSYIYSARDKLKKVVLPDDQINLYSYYPDSDLRFSTTDANNVTKKFFYEGSNVIEELDNYHGTTASYIEGLGIDQHIAKVAGGNVYAYISDPLGTVRNIIDYSGQILNSYDYKAYGEIRNRAEAVNNDYLYTGRRWNEDTKDYYYL